MSRPTRRNTAGAAKDDLGRGRRRILQNDSESSSSSSSSDEEMASNVKMEKGAKSNFRKPQNPSERRNVNVGATQKSQNDPPRTQSQARTQRNVTDEDFVDEFLGTREFSEEEMVKNTMEYMFVQQRTLSPIRKSDIIKLAMNKQSRDFRNIIMAVSDVLLDIFGLRLVGMKCSPDGVGFQKCDVEDAMNFLLVSKFRQGIPTLVKPADSLSNDLVQAGLLLILSSTYMLEKQLDEDTIWEIFENMGFSEQLCKRREDFKRFLKTKYVDTMYLTRTEIKDVDEIKSRYDWGFRAHEEISKYALLKFISQQLHGKDPAEFPVQFSKIPKKEVELVNGEDERMDLDFSMLDTNEQVSANDSDEDDGEILGTAAAHEASK